MAMATLQLLLTGILHRHIYIYFCSSQTSASMTYTNWKKYFTQYLEYIRSQIDGQFEIAHNSSNG